MYYYLFKHGCKNNIFNIKMNSKMLDSAWLYPDFADTNVSQNFYLPEFMDGRCSQKPER